MTMPSFERASPSASPFPHARIPAILPADVADAALVWLRDDAPWTLRVEDFYEQHELSLMDLDLPPQVACLTSDGFLSELRRRLPSLLGTEDDIDLVDVSAHRLTAGQRIRIHNDFLGDEETHRLLVQLNAGWTAENGGLLMIFERDTPESVRHIVMPTHASGFAFEISPASFHAVSAIRDGERFTVVYTFRRRDAGPTGAKTA